ncbi:ROK family protein [Alteribacter populi]|uniref:ROK family protein n=1 Tax=Alteribacter populi TaxID=2011011 RepID=UPI000BBB5EC9|nr:ROK family protein [Alteribacter populi]
MLRGAIEAGGTKFVCAVGNQSGEIVDKVTLPTKGPEVTLQEVYRFFHKYPIEALGVGSFGPIDLNKNSDRYGYVLNTPKVKWKNFHFLGELESQYNVPVFLDTDVNVAALGEFTWGAAKDVTSALYITVGTGIGAGFVKDGQTLIGKNHPEMGHVFVQKHKDDSFKGCCPYHNACLEGLASGPAIKERYGVEGHLLGEECHVWELEAYYLAQAIMNYTLVLSPERIILGGGVLKQEGLYRLIRKKVANLMNGYVDIENMDEYIVPPQLMDEQGIKGALALTGG